MGNPEIKIKLYAHKSQDANSGCETGCRFGKATSK